MSFSFLPKIIAREVTDLKPEFLREKGIRLLMLDFDNTIVPYTTDTPTEKVADWLKEMTESGIQLCIVSNSKRNRVPKFCKENGLDCVTYARKPSRKGILKCLERYNTPAKNAALVGDQIYTDTLGANRAGVTSILVKAIHNHNVWLKLRHVAEMPFILAARKRKLK